MSYADQIALVENALRDLIRDWERYFAGDLRVPPTGLQERLERRLRLLAEEPSRQRTQQFRLEQLQHRLATYAQNWNRMLREREEGRGRFATPSAPGGSRPAPPPPNGAAAGSVPPAEDGSLYDRYVAAKRAQGEEVAVDRGAFEAQIESERAKLQDRLGQPVRFDVMVADGKVKLAARKQRSAKAKE
jgi:hypothetical protein